MNERQHKKHYSKLEKARNTLQQKQLPPRTPLGDRNTNPTSKGTPLTPLKRTSASRTPWGGPPVDPVGKSPLSSDPFASRRSLADLAKTRSPPFFVSTLCLRFYMLFYVFLTMSSTVPLIYILAHDNAGAISARLTWELAAKIGAHRDFTTRGKLLWHPT